MLAQLDEETHANSINVVKSSASCVSIIPCSSNWIYDGIPVV
jgi:hypothetical protein